MNMNDEKRNQERKTHLASLVRLITAMAAILGSIGFNSYPSLSKPIMATKEISWDSRTDKLGISRKINQDFKFLCPPNGRIVGVVDGTDTYSSESSICSAAIHAGLITIRGGGKVAIKIRPNIGTYVGTTRHDISSRGAAFNLDSSFIFLQPNGSPVADANLKEIGWDTRPDNLDLAGRLDQDFKFLCPSDGRVIGVVDGTDTYSSASSVCSAAVHAGLITIRGGGKVAIRIRPNIVTYVGTTRHDISSRGAAFNVPFSFIFLQPNGSPTSN